MRGRADLPSNLRCRRTQAGAKPETTSRPDARPTQISCSVDRPDFARRSARCRVAVAICGLGLCASHQPWPSQGKRHDPRDAHDREHRDSGLRRTRGGSTSSKNGTGSSHSACIGPTGQSPWPTMSAAPSTPRNATPAQSRRLRRHVIAETQMSPRHQSYATARTHAGRAMPEPDRRVSPSSPPAAMRAVGRRRSWGGTRRHPRDRAARLRASLDAKQHAAFHIVVE